MTIVLQNKSFTPKILQPKLIEGVSGPIFHTSFLSIAIIGCHRSFQSPEHIMDCVINIINVTCLSPSPKVLSQ
uniref:Uncharacterized protein n=1 Tax=Arundo donax TaxID=35708 RepID=A0A0A9C6Y1_ARUDO